MTFEIEGKEKRGDKMHRFFSSHVLFSRYVDNTFNEIHFI